MKKLLLYGFIALGLMTSCRKSDNPRLPDLESVPTPKITLDASGDKFITNPSTFNGKFKVDLLFPNGDKPQKMDIVVMKNGSPTNVKVLQAGVTTFPSTFTLTGAQINTLFGSLATPGDTYDIGADIYTQSGKKYQAFPASGAAGYAATVGQQPGASLSIQFSALCPFDITKYGAIGSTVNFAVNVDDWADYSVGQVIPVKIVDATHFSFVYGTDVNTTPIVIAVNPADNSTSITKQAFGSYSSLPSYGAWSVESVAGNAKNTVTPCAFGVSVAMHITAANGYDNGTSIFKITKK